MRTILLGVLVLVVLILVLDAPQPALAGPPSYLLLRPAESSGPRHHGQPAAAYYGVRTDGYAYGYFGVHDRAHWSHSFGVLRTYHQHSRW